MNETRWRYRTATKIGRWRATRREAEDAAINARVARRDERGDFYTDVFTIIEAETGNLSRPRYAWQLASSPREDG